MIKKLSLLACVLAFLSLNTSLSHAESHAEKPKRIVTLIPSLGELAADLLSDEVERIIGVAENSDYPPALAALAKNKRTQVGPYHRFNVEAVLALKPDLVLASKDGNPKDSVLHLRELGLNVVIVETETFAQVMQSMKQVSAALGVPERGIQMAKQFQAGLDRFRERARERESSRQTQNLAAPSVLLQIGDQPLVVAGGNTFLNEALSLLGATNPYADSKTHYPRPSQEDVLLKNPSVILVCVMGKDLAPFEAMVRNWQPFTSLQAVKNKRVSLLDSDPLLRPTLRLLEGLSVLEKKLFPQSPPASSPQSSYGK